MGQKSVETLKAPEIIETFSITPVIKPEESMSALTVDGNLTYTVEDEERRKGSK